MGGTVRSATRTSGVRAGVLHRTERGVLRRAERLREAAEQVSGDHERAVRAVRDAWEPLHREAVRERLGRMPAVPSRWAAGLRRLPAGAWERSGLRSVRDVLDAGAWGVAHSAQVGRRTAEKVWNAARRTADEVDADTAVRLDPDPLDPGTAALLNALRVLVEAGPEARDAAREGARLAGELDRLLAEAAPPPAGGSCWTRPPRCAGGPRRPWRSCAACWTRPDGRAPPSGSRRRRSTC
jgi:hypothetical protein